MKDPQLLKRNRAMLAILVFLSLMLYVVGFIRVQF